VVVLGGASEEVAWSSSNGAVATVSSSGRVAAVGAGVAVISVVSVVDGSKGDSVAVTVAAPSVEPGVPASISVVAGDGQSAVVGSAVGVAPSAVVRDAGGRALAGVSVSFVVTAGGGSVAPGTPVTTDADGIARLSSWVLGSVAGSNSVRATVSGSSPSVSTTFGATGTPGAASAATSTVTASPSLLLADGSSTSHVSVRLRDAFGNALTSGGAAVSFAAPSQGSIGAVTDNGNGTYSATYTAGTSPGTVVLTPRVAGVAFSNTVSVTLSSAVLSVRIDQRDPSVRLGGTVQLTASVVTVGGAASTVSWSSSDASVATVGASSGLVTPVGAGVAMITATSTVDGSKSDSVRLTVPAPMVLTVDSTPLAGGEEGTVTLLLGGSVDVTVDWGDGNSTSTAASGPLSHTYDVGGIYTIAVAGRLSHFRGSSGIVGVSSWGDVGLTSLSGAFSGASNLASVPNTLPPTVTDTSYMFSGVREFNQHIGGWDVSNVTNMRGMFAWADFDPDIAGWDVSSVTDMGYMFEGNMRFNEDIGQWNVSNVTNMEFMFNGDDGLGSRFNQNLSAWDVSNVTTMRGMFRWADSFDQPLDSWNVSKVTDMRGMFYNTPFNQDLDSWDVSNVTTMSYMFAGFPDEDSAFNGKIESWDVSSVTNMSGMFSVNRSFDQPIGDWDVSSVTDMSFMFGGSGRPVVPFNRDIGAWNVSSVTNMEEMFSGAELFNQDLSGWCVEAIPEEPLRFTPEVTSWTLPQPVWGTCPSR
jgi:surface protein